MPRRAKGPRLWLRPARADREAIWVIVHRRKERSTGCGESDTEGAERALAAYLTEQYEPPKTSGKLAKSNIADVINIYIKERAPKTARPDFLIYTAGSALDWWGDKTLADVRA